MPHQSVLSPTDIVPGDHVSGNPQVAQATLLEYGDYECPDCRLAHIVVLALQKELGDDICFVFRNYPLSTLHAHAENAAEAAESAAAAGSFWEMQDLLFEHQGSLDDDDLLEYGFRIGLDPDALARDLDMHRYWARVQQDVESGRQSGVTSTPAFFINGIRHSGDYHFQTLLHAIQTAAATH